MILSALCGWLLADFIAGIAHWWEDRVAHESDGFIGQQVVAPNRLHHRRPTAFLDQDFIARNWTTWLAVAAVSALWLALLGPSIVWAFATLGGAVSSEVHRRAHLPKRNPAVVCIAQEIGIIQSVSHHAGHHRPGSEVRYCPLTNWINPVLDELRFWSRLERLFAAAGVRLSKGDA